MQNKSSKLTLSTVTNEFLHASYIRLVIFLSISFKYYYYFYYFFIRIVLFLNIQFFQLLGKKRFGKGNNMRKFWEKRK
jgi:hypothetical protein